jgi:hypothetical protein
MDFNMSLHEKFRIQLASLGWRLVPGPALDACSGPFQFKYDFPRQVGAFGKKGFNALQECFG